MNFESLYEYWFNNKNLWFNSTSDDDKKITELFENLYKEVIKDSEMKKNKKYAIGVIILYDQISRHVFRIKNNDVIYFWKKDSFLKETTNIAFANSMITYVNFKDELNAEEYSFVMLPFRHTYEFKKIKYVMNETWERLVNEENDNEKNKYKQFLKATYERAIIQSDDSEYIKKYPSSIEIDKFDNWEENFNFNIGKLKNKYTDILDTKCFETINEINNLEVDLKKFNEDKIFCLSKEFLKELNNVSKREFILSISGGVDSMISSYILKKNNITFSCVHINYSNRKESINEEKFVIEWCKILNVDLYVRTIDEINRPICMEYNMRDLYETYTRDIRYGTYLKVNQNPWVILGHNQDDCFENILTNISQKSKYENLFGMELLISIKSNNKTINFIRPMLKISKKSIYQFASIIDIPYLWDSTPKWSQRGKIRDLVRPCLESWDSEMVNGLFEITNVLKESLNLVDVLVNSWINKMDNGKIEEKITNIPSSKIFWKKFFQKLNINCSSRTLDGLVNLLNKLINDKLKIDINAPIKYELNKFYQLKLMKMKDGMARIFLYNKV